MVACSTLSFSCAMPSASLLSSPSMGLRMAALEASSSAEATAFWAVARSRASCCSATRAVASAWSSVAWACLRAADLALRSWRAVEESKRARGSPFWTMLPRGASQVMVRPVMRGAMTSTERWASSEPRTVTVTRNLPRRATAVGTLGGRARARISRTANQMPTATARARASWRKRFNKAHGSRFHSSQLWEADLVAGGEAGEDGDLVLVEVAELDRLLDPSAGGGALGDVGLLLHEMEGVAGDEHLGGAAFNIEVHGGGEIGQEAGIVLIHVEGDGEGAQRHAEPAGDGDGAGIEEMDGEAGVGIGVEMEDALEARGEGGAVGFIDGAGDIHLSGIEDAQQGLAAVELVAGLGGALAVLAEDGGEADHARERGAEGHLGDRGLGAIPLDLLLVALELEDAEAGGVGLVLERILLLKAGDVGLGIFEVEPIGLGVNGAEDGRLLQLKLGLAEIGLGLLEVTRALLGAGAVLRLGVFDLVG